MSGPIGMNPLPPPDLCGRRLIRCLALLSVYNKANLIELAQGLRSHGFNLLGSGGTAKKIRDAGIPIEWDLDLSAFCTYTEELSAMLPILLKPLRC
jgi:hypothetical protein